MTRKEIEAIVAKLDAISGDDPEEAHAEADAILLTIANAEIRKAYSRLVARCAWWACA